MKSFRLYASALALCALPLIFGGCVGECGHDSLSETVIAPTCDQEGYVLHVCDDCSFEYRTDLTPPTGHTLTDTTIPPTCTEEGYTQYECACGYHFQADFVKPIGHTFSKETVAPTCTTAGYVKNTCTACDATYPTDETPPLGHDFEKTAVIEPTCDASGYTEETCTVCGFTYESEIVSPLGHDCTFQIVHPTKESNGSITGTCACGYKRTDTLRYSDVFPSGYVTDNNQPIAKGVDVSKWQHSVGEGGQCAPLDWSAIKSAGFDFAILKAGSSTGIDPVFEMNYRDAKTAGLQLGVYFYTYATTLDDLRADAEILLTWLEGKQFEYPVYFDLEDPSLVSLGKETLTGFCVEFISILRENGYYGALYSNNAWLTENLNGSYLKNEFDIWYARYPSTNEISPDEIRTWNTEKYGTQLGMWQYAKSGVIEGFENVYFDFNYVYRDYPGHIRQYGFNGFSPEDFPKH